MTTGEKIRERRKALGITVNELVRKTGITRHSIYLYEKDEMDPTLFNATCIADALGLSLDYLAGRK